MSNRTCSCGESLDGMHGNRTRCLQCSPARDWSKTKAYEPRPKRSGMCVVCGAGFQTKTANRRFCSPACKYTSSYEPRPRLGPSHGTQRRYKMGCRCDECRERINADAAEYRKKRREEGRPLPAGRGRGSERYGVTKAVRLSIYERDGWVCQLCSEPIDRTLHWNDAWAPTLDHIECQSWSSAPDHSPANLRLAHRICNARRGNERYQSAA